MKPIQLYEADRKRLDDFWLCWDVKDHYRQYGTLTDLTLPATVWFQEEWLDPSCAHIRVAGAKADRVLTHARTIAVVTTHAEAQEWVDALLPMLQEPR